MQPVPSAAAVPLSPTRLLFIASIGNQGPYRRTRHSAGHVLLDELAPVLRRRWTGPSASPSTSQPSNLGAYYTTWYSPSFMNESGPKLVKQVVKWFGRQDEVLRGVSAKNEWLEGLVPSSAPTGVGYPATLVILHDELEAPLGKIRVKRGGPEVASLRGHRGLISAFESLRGKGMYPPAQNQNQNQNQRKRGKEKDTALPRDFSVLRVGIGIGRPDSRAKNAVADYVLTEMDAAEIAAMQKAVDPIVGILEEELFSVTNN